MDRRGPSRNYFLYLSCILGVQSNQYRLSSHVYARFSLQFITLSVTSNLEAAINILSESEGMGRHAVERVAPVGTVLILILRKDGERVCCCLSSVCCCVGG